MRHTRRHFIGTLALGGSALTVQRALPAWGADAVGIPPHLKNYANLYRQEPRKASLQWLREARFGMMPCYYLASLDGRHCFEQWKFKMAVREYEKNMQRFTAAKFDAGALCDLVVAAGMKYVCFVAKRCEGFCLWDTRLTTFNSVNSAAKRDLVAEMVTACNARGLGFFAFYEYGFDWHHPHGPRRKDFKNDLVEIAYPAPESAYAYGEDYDLNRYIDFAHAQIEELLTNYGPIAGVWLDGVATPLSGDPTKSRCQELYDKIRTLQPHALVSFKTGVTGTEDFYAPERQQLQHIKPGDTKLIELCEPLNPSWSFVKNEAHRNADWVMQRLAFAQEKQMTYLLGLGPLPDGSVFPADAATLSETGRRIRENGWPKGVKDIAAPAGEVQAY